MRQVCAFRELNSPAPRITIATDRILSFLPAIAKAPADCILHADATIVDGNPYLIARYVRVPRQNEAARRRTLRVRRTQ
jgi:hypothetical protein